MPDEIAQRYIRNPGPKVPVSGLKAAASTDNAIVTEAVLKMLEAGGNAVDAALTACLLQPAVEPFMTNHTGTVTFLYWEAATGKLHQLDSVGTMPDGLAPFRPIPPIGGGLGATGPVACIPGFMPGLKAIYERFATKPWADLCQDAIRWAEEGHPVSTFEYGMNLGSQDFITYFPEGRAFYMPDGFWVPVGERFGSKPMAEMLRRVAEEGPDYMITGGWADKLIAKSNEMGWPITKDHMVETPPRWIEPVRFKHRDHEIVGLAPPQQQGVFCSLVLGILAHLGIGDTEPGSAEHIFYMAHALRFAQYHCGFMGDPAVADYSIEQLLDDDFHRIGAKLIKGMKPKLDLTDHVLLTGKPGGGAFSNSSPGRPTGGISRKPPTGSCELAIVDRHGNWVQMMNTLQAGGIPGMVIDGVPMIGTHTSFGGLTGFMDAKVIKGTRMRCVIGNTIVLKDGVPVFSLGTPGNVHYTVPQVLTYLLDFKMSPYQASDAPRMLALDEDGSVTIEDRVSPDAIRGLARMGVQVRALPPYDYHMGSFQMCYRDPATGLLGASADPRRCGVADGLR
ncbi:MAG TPA: gamma-glutamyltransferase [Aliidongia sp.]|nr:gamma-glutamyltransferase [Aliidongia sp.]